MTKLCVAIMVQSVEQALAHAAQAAERGADIVEYRFDRFAAQPEVAVEIVGRSPLPCIVTCRPVWEGGQCDADEDTRARFFVRVSRAPKPPAYIDAELALADRNSQAYFLIQDNVRIPGGEDEDLLPRLILSSHDFVTRPPDLLRRLGAMVHDSRTSVFKLAWRARSLRDNIEAFELIGSRADPIIALCMGEYGFPSRVLAKKFGAFLTFAGLDEDNGTAPGQVGIDTMKRLYRWDAINPATRVFGVIGHPVGHSMSPAIHNAGFDATGYDGVYLPMPIPPEYEHFKATVHAWLDYKPLDFRGASVTIPHKENLLRFVRESGGAVEPLAERIGAANTLTVRDDGSLYASNTDYAAAIDAVCDALGIKREQLAGRRVAVIGAGGAARAVVAAFAHYGATIVIYNRTLDRARQLAEQFTSQTAKVVAADMANLCKSCCEIYINCTPIGMHPSVDASPITDWSGEKPALVFDTIYNPIETKLLRDARSQGIATVSGLEMFVRQAAAQFDLWTGRPAPTDVFRNVIRQKLAAVTS